MRAATRPIMKTSNVYVRGTRWPRLARRTRTARHVGLIRRRWFQRQSSVRGGTITPSPERPRDAFIAGRITMVRFSVRTFGFPEIRRDDGPCQLALRKGLALLIYLAEAKGSVGRDVLATVFWPERAEEVVRARLRRLLHRLQLALGEDVLTTDRSTL